MPALELVCLIVFVPAHRGPSADTHVHGLPLVGTESVSDQWEDRVKLLRVTKRPLPALDVLSNFDRSRACRIE